MSKTNPLYTTKPRGDVFCEFGLTKREYFAAAALQGVLSSSLIAALQADPEAADVIAEYLSGEKLAEGAVDCADALIEALNREEGEKP